VLLGLLRDTGVTQRMHAAAGQFQMRLPEGKTFHLLQLRLDGSTGLVPEISGHRLLVSVRMMRPDADGRLKSAAEDTDFELTLCA
jgi:cell division protein ZapD